jgi:hypothetical protein
MLEELISKPEVAVQGREAQSPISFPQLSRFRRLAQPLTSEIRPNQGMLGMFEDVLRDGTGDGSGMLSFVVKDP